MPRKKVNILEIIKKCRQILKFPCNLGNSPEEALHVFRNF